MKRMYLDHAATTPLHPEVLEAMLPYMQHIYGNPSSLHYYGRSNRSAIHQARERIAGCVGCKANELVFTSSGTESDNAALFGIARAHRAMHPDAKPGHLITTQIEHQAVLHACQQLEREGFRVSYLPVDETGLVQLDDLENAIQPDTILVSVMFANNEVGTIQPIQKIGEMLRSRNILFHVDAVQALGMIPICLLDLPVDLMSFSAHKVNGPLGIGALYIAEHVHQWLPLFYGGAQERKRRAGTENVPGMIGFAQAIVLAKKNNLELQLFAESFRINMITMLQEKLGKEGFVINGHPTERLPHILNVSFPGIDTETLLMNLDLAGIAAASGSACSSGSHEVSHVLQAMRLPEEVIRSAIRFSFGTTNMIEEAETAAQKTATIVQRIRDRNIS